MTGWNIAKAIVEKGSTASKYFVRGAHKFKLSTLSAPEQWALFNKILAQGGEAAVELAANVGQFTK